MVVPAMKLNAFAKCTHVPACSNNQYSPESTSAQNPPMSTNREICATRPGDAGLTASPAGDSIVATAAPYALPIVMLC
ncbi:hypothetical protein GCM10009675_39520 [Prauserella alba]|uniref:Uncharacterized protein n=1 Tax=Prauserella alba TaxID=176898 RepID=A0ABN1VLE6_9PSEU